MYSGGEIFGFVVLSVVLVAVVILVWKRKQIQEWWYNRSRRNSTTNDMVRNNMHIRQDEHQITEGDTPMNKDEKGDRYQITKRDFLKPVTPLEGDDYDKWE